MNDNLRDCINEAADKYLVEKTAKLMTERLAEKRNEGYGLWFSRFVCEPEELLERAKKSLEEGDLLDCINLLAMTIVAAGEGI